MQSGDASILSTKIEIGQALLDLCQKGHAAHTSILGGLGVSFGLCYKVEENISDLNRAIDIGQKWLDLCPHGHPDHASALGNLAESLQKYHYIQQNNAELEKIIKMQQAVLALCPFGHPDHAWALGQLALCLKAHYYVQGNITDLNMAIEMEQKQLALCPLGHSNHAEVVGNLALSLAEWYHKEGNLTDFNKAIELQERKLESHPLGHQSHGLALYNLALTWRDHYNATKTHSSLVTAVKLLKKALTSYPVQHSYFATVVHTLAETILLPVNSSHQYDPANPTFPLPQEAFEIYDQLKTCAPAVSSSLLKATQSWVENAERHNHPLALEAYQTSLDTLDHFTSMQSSLHSRYETMQAKVADLANNGFSCAMRHGHEDFPMGVELLERGRGILWNQLARFDISIVALESQGDEGRELGKKFMRLSADLRARIATGSNRVF